MRTYLKACRHGNFVLLYGDMISEYVNLYGEWCEAEMELLRSFVPGDGVVVEVGANIGMHTVALAKMCPQGWVVCFEPQRAIYQLLCANLALNNLLNVRAFHAGVADVSGEVTLPLANYERPWNYGAFSLDRGFSAEQTFDDVTGSELVDVVSVDAHFSKHPGNRLDVLKVDAEGFELRVLKGASQTISVFRPTLFIENNRQESCAELLSQVRALEYVPFWFCSARHRGNNFNGTRWHVEGVDINVLCVPTEKAGRVHLVEARSFSQVVDGNVPIC